MSDYLANLVLRTLSPERCLQPFLPSVFEPLPTRVGVDDGPRFHPATYSASSAVQDEAPSTSSSLAAQLEPQLSPETSVPSSHLASPKSLAALELRKSGDRSFSRRVEPVLTIPAEPDGKVKARNVPESSLPTARIVDREAPDFVAIAGPHRLVQPMVTAEALAPQIGAFPLSPALSTKSSEKHSVRQPLSRRLVPTEEARVSPTVRPPSSVPPMAGLKSKSDDNVAPGTINVTIGRVEVRASVASASPRPKSASATVMNLDEYLRKRASGGA